MRATNYKRLDMSLDLESEEKQHILLFRNEIIFSHRSRQAIYVSVFIFWIEKSVFRSTLILRRLNIKNIKKVRKRYHVYL